MEQYALTEVSVSSLRLDPENPRLPKSMKNKSENQIINYLLANASVTELMESICQNGFFPGEPLIAIQSEDAKSYIVIEGNRRTTALKLLLKPSLAKSQKNKVLEITSNLSCAKPSTVPVLVSPNRSSISKYLGFRHITGIKSWKALEKARYLDHLKGELLKDNPEATLRELSRALAAKIGSRSDYVKKILISFEVYKLIEDKEFFNIPGLDDTSFYFTTLADSLSRESISNYLGIDFAQDNDALMQVNYGRLKKWCNWFFYQSSPGVTKVTGTSANISMLSRVVENHEAMEYFEKGGSLSDAADMTSQSSELLMQYVLNAKLTLVKAKGLTSKSKIDFTGVGDELKEIATICREINLISMSQGGDDFDV